VANEDGAFRSHVISAAWFRVWKLVRAVTGAAIKAAVSLAIAAVEVLKQWGVSRIKFVGLIAAPEGIAALHALHPDVDVHIGAVDERLTNPSDPFPSGYIWPGLGDAGDRQFGTA